MSTCFLDEDAGPGDAEEIGSSAGGGARCILGPPTAAPDSIRSWCTGCQDRGRRPTSSAWDLPPMAYTSGSPGHFISRAPLPSSSAE